MPIRHAKETFKADSSDPTVIQPSDWNADHVLNTTGILYGAFAGSPIQSVSAGQNYNAVLRRKFNSSISEEYEFARLPAISAADYMFLPQTGQTDLTGGTSNTITLSPVPLGINFNNVDHYIVIIDSDPVLSESVKIIGGNAVSGNASGAIVVNPVNNHDAFEYQIWTATSGIMEAYYSGQLSNGGIITVPPGQLNIYGPTIINRDNIEILGHRSFLMIQETCVLPVFSFGPSGSFCKISNLSLDSSDVTLAPIFLDLTGQTNFTASELQIKGVSDGINAISCSNCSFHNISIENFLGAGFKFTTSHGINISNCTAISGHAEIDSSGIVISSGSNIKILNCLLALSKWGLLCYPTTEAAIVSQILVMNSVFSGCFDNGINLFSNAPYAMVRQVSIVNCIVMNSGTSGMKIDFNAGYVRGINVIGNQFLLNKDDGIYINSEPISIRYINIQGNLIEDNNQNNNGRAGIWLNKDANTITIIGNQILSARAVNPSTGSDVKMKYGIYIGINSGKNLIIQGNVIPEEGFTDNAIYLSDPIQGQRWLIQGNPSHDNLLGVADQDIANNKLILFKNPIGASAYEFSPTTVVNQIFNFISGGHVGQVLKLIISHFDPINVIKLTDNAVGPNVSNLRLNLANGNHTLNCGMVEVYLNFVWISNNFEDGYWALFSKSGPTTETV